MAPKKPEEWTESDRAALDHARQELEEQRHRSWLWQSLGRVSKWVLATIAGITIIVDAIIRLLKVWAEP